MISILASPAYLPCHDCGNSDFKVLSDGRLMCSEWDECGQVYDSPRAVMKSPPIPEEEGEL